MPGQDLCHIHKYKSNWSNSFCITTCIDSRLRSRVNVMYRNTFETLEAAEIHYGLTLSDSLAELTIEKRPANSSKQAPGAKSNTQMPIPPLQTTATPPPRSEQTVTVENVFKVASLLDNADLEILLNKLFLHLTLAHDITSNPAKFCSLSIRSMKLLKQNNKSNLLYKFALALCQTNPITGEPVFPMNRMPFGLVEYQIEFFSCTNVNQVSNAVLYKSLNSAVNK